MEGCECTEATGRHAQVSCLDNCNRLGRAEWGKRVNSSTQRFGARMAYGSAGVLVKGMASRPPPI